MSTGTREKRCGGCSTTFATKRTSGPLLPIYLGDDITDEDAFDAVQDDGVAILVRHSDDGDRATAAGYALDDPDRVRDFTERLARQLTR